MNVDTLHCQVPGFAPRGVGGRIGDALAAKGFKTSSYSFVGKAGWSQGFDVNVEDVAGRKRFENLKAWNETMLNITSQQHNNVYCEEYAKSLKGAVESSERLAHVFSNVQLETDFQTSNRLEQQLKGVASMIKQRKMRNAERDLFYVRQGGYDTHQGKPDEGFASLDTALRKLVKELEAQQIFDSVTVFTTSEFGRTLSFNGAGTDHGWGGNHIVLGGGVKGGRILNDYPPDLRLRSEYDAGRGRIIPQYPWESVMVPIAEWMGVEPDQHKKVFPNLGNFESQQIIKDLYE